MHRRSPPYSLRRLSSLLLIAAALILTGCSTDVENSSEEMSAYTVRYQDRVIDLEPFLIGFPYSRHIVDIENGHLFFQELTGDGTWLRHLEMGEGEQVQHAQGRKVSGVDWAKRSLSGGTYHPPSNRLFVTSDEANDEHLNIYAVDLESGSVERLTHNDYTSSWNFSNDYRQLAWLNRKGLQEPFNTCLVVRDLDSGDEREVLCDEGGKNRFTWSLVRFSPDNRSVFVRIQHDGERSTTSLTRIRLDAKEPIFDFIIPQRVMRYNLYQLEGWIGDSAFLYVSAEEGFSNIYRYDSETNASTRLTNYTDELGPVVLMEGMEPPAVLVVLKRPQESELQLVDALTGKLLNREVFPATVGILDGHGNRAVLVYRSLQLPFEAHWLTIERGAETASWRITDFAGVPPEMARQLNQFSVEKVEYPTFDRLLDGSQRMLHAFLLTPKNPPAGEADRLVFIESFYGGSNQFSAKNQILAAAGIATFSPAPRGSYGFGAEFAALNDKDLGGDEIVDIMYGAKWLVKDRGYEPAQIGVTGVSHGGYATMRLMTFPPRTNGRNESFDFGFGWSHAGFADILSFYDSTNIPDFVLKEAGDPKTDADRLRDRSPLNHVDRLESPLLLTHGSNDRRVPVEESRKFAAKAKELGRPVELVEFEGQGHRIQGFENQVRYYQTVLSFLERATSEH